MGPKGVAVDRNGHIITVDNKACCVFIFQSNGKLVTKFGARGTSDRQFAGEEGAWVCKIQLCGFNNWTFWLATNNANFMKKRKMKKGLRQQFASSY